MKILVVDDDIAMLLMASKSLEKFNGFTVKTAENIDEAFRKLNAENFEVILSDYIMEDGSGDGDVFLERLQATDILRDAPVIFFTGTNDENVLKTMMAKGAKGVISKPFIPKELGSKILDIINSGS